MDRDLGDYDDLSIWDRARSESMFGQRISVPSPADSLFIALVHGIRALSDCRVLWIVDAVRIIQRGIDDEQWLAFVQKCVSLDLQTIVSDVLGYLAERYRVCVPQFVLDAVRPGRRATAQRIEYARLLGQPGRRPVTRALAGSYLAFCRSRIDQPRFAGSKWIAGKTLSALGFLPGLAPAQYPLNRLINRNDTVAAWIRHRAPHFMQPRALDRGIPDCPVGRRISFAKNGMGHWFAFSGWALQEDTHLWSDGYQARLALRPAGAYEGPLRIELNMFPYLPPSRREAKIDLAISGGAVKRLNYKSGGPNFENAIFFDPENEASDRVVDLVITPITPRRPSREESLPDDRLLGVCLRSLRLTPVPVIEQGEWLKFAAGETGVNALGCGWWAPETIGVWSAMRRTDLLFRIGQNLADVYAAHLSSVQLAFEITTRVPPGGTVRITLTATGWQHGRKTYSISDSGRQTLFMSLGSSSDVLRPRQLQVHLRLNKLHRLTDIRGSGDGRTVGIMLHRVNLKRGDIRASGHGYIAEG
jgi:hypothetical protein